MPFQPDALDADTLRKLAKRLRRAITDHLSVTVATHQSQAILAQAFSFPDWHGALAAVSAEPRRVADAQPALDVTPWLVTLSNHRLMALLEGLVQTLDRYLPHAETSTEPDPGIAQEFWNETLQQTAHLFERLDEVDLCSVCQSWQTLPAENLTDYLLIQFRQVDLRLALAFERGSGNLHLSLPFRVLYGLEEARAHLDPSRPTLVRQRMAASSSFFSGEIFSTRKWSEVR